MASELVLTAFDGMTAYDFQIAGVLPRVERYANADRYIYCERLTDQIKDSAMRCGFRPIDVSTLRKTVDNKVSFVERTYDSDTALSAYKYPNTSVSMLDHLAYDRLWWYIPGSYLMDLTHALRQMACERVTLVGTASTADSVALSFAIAARRCGIEVRGIPIGAVSGRLAPMWLGICDRILATDEADAALLESGGLPREKVSLLPGSSVSPPFQAGQSRGGLVLLDFLLSSPRDSVRTVIADLASRYSRLDFIAMGDGELELYRRLYPACEAIVDFRPGQTYFDGFKQAEMILSFYPFRALHLAKALNAEKRIVPIDLMGRFRRVDKMAFESPAETLDDIHTELRTL